MTVLSLHKDSWSLCNAIFLQACLIADIVQHFVDAKLEFDASYVYQDVNQAIQHVHKSGLMHRGILSDPQKYLVKNVSKLFSSLLLSLLITSQYILIEEFYWLTDVFGVMYESRDSYFAS